MNKLRFLPVSIAAAGVLFGALPSLSLAQGFTLEEVVVTARKREESLQDVPVAVSTFNASDFNAYNMVDTKAIAAYTPGVHIETNAAGNLSSAMTTIRGQVQTDTLATLDPSVGWYLNDVYLARTPGTVASLFDLERVEVLKGPQGTLYGRNTTGGAVKVVTAKADAADGVTGFVEGGLGNFGKQKYGGAVNLPIVPDVAAVRLSFLSDENKDGWGSQTVTPIAFAPFYPADNPWVNFPTSRQDFGQKDVEMYRLSGVFTPTEDLSVELFYEQNEFYANSLLVNPFNSPVAGPAPNDIFRDARTNYRHTTWADTETLSLTLSYDIGDTMNTKLIYGHRELDSEYMSDVDGSTLPLNWFTRPLENISEQDSIEWQLSGTAFEDKLDWMVGLYWFEETAEDNSTSNGGNPLTSGVWATPAWGDVDNESQSAFVALTWHVSDTVNVNLGLRETEDTKALRMFSAKATNPALTQFVCRFDVNNPPPNADISTCTWGQETDYSFTSYTAGIDWRLNDDVMVYLKSSNAFRAGGQNMRGLGVIDALDAAGALIPSFNSSAAFDPEEVQDVEVGLKGQFLDNRVQINAAYFHMWYDDIQKSLLLTDVTNNSGLITFVANTSAADYDGVEIEAQWIVSDSFALFATYGWLDWEYENKADISPLAPDEEYSLRANYRIPVEVGEVLFDVNYSYRGEMYTNSSSSRASLDAAAGGVIKSVDLVGARVGLNMDSGLSIALWGKNLTDEEYYMSRLALSLPASLYAGGVGEPRSYGLDVRYEF